MALLQATFTGSIRHAMFATSPRHRGDDGDWDESHDQAEREPFEPLTRVQAQALASRDPSVSPWRVVAVQALAGAVCVGVAWGVGQRAGTAWSALYGALAAVLPSALMARGMTRRTTRNAVAAAAGFMFWEMLKIGVAVAMLVIAAKVVPGLSWPVLLVTMVVCIKVNWFALLWRGPRAKTTKA